MVDVVRTIYKLDKSSSLTKDLFRKIRRISKKHGRPPTYIRLSFGTFRALLPANQEDIEKDTEFYDCEFPSVLFQITETIPFGEFDFYFVS